MVDQTSQFYAILTNVGAAKQANADALGIPWTITQMAIGDGNLAGSDNPPLPMPTAAWTSLLNEWRRAPLNQLKVDEKNNAVIVAEQVIPADVGGRWIREMALFDADGDMVAVANCAPTFKPLLSQGSGRTQVVRINLIVSSSSNVQLKIDPSVVLATREWVTEELAKQDFKHSVLAATTGPIALSGLQTIDGVLLSAGSRVLVKNQAEAKDNGLYQVVAGGPWTRCADADTGAKVTPGLLVMVERGTVNSDTAWQLLTDATIALGVTGLTFGLAFGRTGIAAGTYRSVTVDTYGRVVVATNPTTVAGYGLTDVYTNVQVNDLVQSATIRATQAEAEGGTEGTKVMTPLRVFQAIAKVVVQATETVFGWAKVATQVQVTAGTDDATIITPKKLRAAQATQAEAEAGTDNAKVMTPLRVFQAIAKVVVQATETVFGWAKVATQAQVNSGIDDETIVTPKKLRFGFSIVLGGNGYIAFPSWLGGLIVQWGAATLTAAGTATVTLPLEYPGGQMSALATHLAPTGGVALSTSAYTKTSLGINAATASTHAVRYLSLGY